MKLFKSIRLVAFVLLSLAVLFGCSSNKSADQADGASNFDGKQLIVGFDAEYPPYGFLADDGETYTGFDLDLAREVCKRNNLEFVAQPIAWDAKDFELNSGNIDCIWNGFTINGRENDYTWSFPYVDNSIVLIVNASSDIKTKADLKDKTVMVQSGSSGYAALTDEENAENVELVKTFKSLELCQDYNNAFMNLEAGVVDCVAVDIGVAKYQIENGKGKFIQLAENVSSEQYGIGFKKGNTELKDLVESTLADMWKDGTFMKIANNYAEYALPDSICIGNYIK